MGLLDQILSQVAGAIKTPATGETNAAPDVAAHVVEVVQERGLSNLLQQFQEHKMGAVVSSWIGNGANLPISGEQIQQVMGSEVVQKFAERFGVSPEQAATLMAQVLPHAVDKMTPEGAVEEPAATATATENEPS